MFAAQEEAIIQRLKARMPDGVHVGALRELERVPQMRQKAPAVWVIYDGFTLGDRITPTGSVQQVNHEWFVVIAAKSARGNGDESAARDEAAELCEHVLKALLGYHLGQANPALGGKYLQLQDAPGPLYDGGYCHVPLAFVSGATFKGEN